MLLDANGNEIAPGQATGSAALVHDTPDYNPPASPTQQKLWQDELDKIADPKLSHLTSLKLWWVPGDPWPGGAVNRWYIYQVFPEGIFPFGIDPSELKGPDPRTYATHYDQILQRVVRKVHLSIDRLQWLLFQETGRFCTPLWVVQGANGGHLRHFTYVQTAISKLEGGWEHPPAPGDLPYAEPDRRTFDAIRELDMLVKHEGLLAFHLRSPEAIQGEMKDRAEEMRKRMWAQLKSQQEGYWSDENGVVKAIREQLPHGLGKGSAKGPDYEAIEQRFIQDD